MSRMVRVVDLSVHVDDRGELAEILRSDDEGFVDFGQVYLVRSRVPQTVRAWHRHRYMWDHFAIVNGAAKFGFVDASIDESADAGAEPYSVVASERRLVRIDVPPGVWHGWVSLERNTLLVSIASVPYMGIDRERELDEERVAPYFFSSDNDFWEIKCKSSTTR